MNDLELKDWLAHQQHDCDECSEPMQRVCPDTIRWTGKPACDLLELFDKDTSGTAEFIIEQIDLRIQGWTPDEGFNDVLMEWL